MAKRPDLPCAGCGRLMWRGPGTLPAGQARCRDCRKGEGPGATGRSKPRAKSAAPAPERTPAREPDPPAEPKPPKPSPYRPAITEALADDDQLAALRALRNRIGRMLDASDSARDVASLTRQFIDVCDRITSLEGGVAPKQQQGGGTPLDELRRKRAARRADAAGGARS